jgi:hypothetical protein
MSFSRKNGCFNGIWIGTGTLDLALLRPLNVQLTLFFMRKSFPIVLLLLLPMITYAQKAVKHTSNQTASDSTSAAASKAAQKKPTTSAKSDAIGAKSAPPQNDSLIIGIVKDWLDIMQKLQKIKESETSGQKTGDPVPKESIYGYISLKDPTQVKTYSVDDGSYIRSKDFDNYIKKIPADKLGDTLKLNSDVKYDLLPIDSLLIKVTKNKLVRIVIFAEKGAFVCPLDIDNFEVLNDGKSTISFYRTSESRKISIFLSDILQYVPMEDTGNIKAVNDYLSSSSKRINLINQ